MARPRWTATLDMRICSPVIALLLVAGCASRPAEHVPVFEVRDFKMVQDLKQLPAGVLPDDATITSYWNGRGTLFVKEREFQNGTYLLFILETNTTDTSKNSNAETTKQVILKDGTGEITTTAAEWLRPGEVPKGMPKYNWTLVGFTKLQDGRIEVASK